jgi:HEAT repeat protein
VVPLNEAEASRHQVRLTPPGVPGEDRIKAAFTVDEARQLRVTVTDLKTRKKLLRNAVIARLGESAAPSAAILSAPTIDKNLPFEEQMAQLKEQLVRELEPKIMREYTGQAGEEGSAPEAVTLTGHEPCLSVASGSRGQRRLSLRHLGTLLNALPPEAISLEAAAAMLRSSEFYVRYNAGKMLARRGDRDARRLLQEALNDAPAPSRASAARHLYGFSWFAAEPLIRQALADSDHRVREAAVYALCDMQDLDAYQLAAEALQTEVDEVRMAAAWALRSRQNPAAVPVLEAALLAQDPLVRVQALEALGANNTPEATPVVRRSIDADLDPEVKYAATLSLIELEGESCLAELADIIRRTDGVVCQHILRGLFQATNYLHIDLGECAAIDTLVDALEKALRDPAPLTRAAAVWPLAWMQHDRAPGILVDAYRREPDADVRYEILRITTALMSPAGAPILADARDSADERLRSAATWIEREIHSRLHPAG